MSKQRKSTSKAPVKSNPAKSNPDPKPQDKPKSDDALRVELILRNSCGLLQNPKADLSYTGMKWKWGAYTHPDTKQTVTGWAPGNMDSPESTVDVTPDVFITIEEFMDDLNELNETPEQTLLRLQKKRWAEEDRRGAEAEAKARGLPPLEDAKVDAAVTQADKRAEDPALDKAKPWQVPYDDTNPEYVTASEILAECNQSEVEAGLTLNVYPKKLNVFLDKHQIPYMRHETRPRRRIHKKRFDDVFKAQWKELLPSGSLQQLAESVRARIVAPVEIWECVHCNRSVKAIQRPGKCPACGQNSLCKKRPLSP